MLGRQHALERRSWRGAVAQCTSPFVLWFAMYSVNRSYDENSDAEDLCGWLHLNCEQVEHFGLLQLQVISLFSLFGLVH